MLLFFDKIHFETFCMEDRSMVNLMIADDHQMIREGLKQLLELDGDMKVIAEAKDGNDCLDLLNIIHPDVLLLDINMPNKNGIDVLKELKMKRDKVKTLILTVHNEVEYLLNAVDIGADGYILKDSNSLELKKAILCVYDGKTYIQPNLIPILNSKMISRDSDQVKIDSLTKRELEILILLSEGLLNRQIAERCKISERTVKNHIANIFKKIHVADRTQAAVFAIKNNLVHI